MGGVRVFNGIAHCAYVCVFTYVCTSTHLTRKLFELVHSDLVLVGLCEVNISIVREGMA